MEFTRSFLMTLLITLLSFTSLSASSTTILANGLGGSAGFGENTLTANDDGSTAFIDLSSVFPSGFNFFGNNYTGLYVNNNGNITFNTPQAAFTPTAITGTTSNPIIAAYFADVDTRGTGATVTPGGNSTGSNLVYWDLDSANGIFTATWDDVGYYSRETRLLNAFQIALINKNNGNFNIELRYEDLNWTTGNASGGTGGLGGTVARAGWSSGNGSDYEELVASGNQADMLNLTNTSNVGIEGLYRFGVRNGNVSIISEPNIIAMLSLALLILARRFNRKIEK